VAASGKHWRFHTAVKRRDVKSLLADEPLLRDQTGDETHGDAFKGPEQIRADAWAHGNAPGSAVFRFMSAMCRFPSIKAGMEAIGYGNRIIQNATKNEQAEFFEQQD
jgi:hypothetical protein